jgi:arylsulfatase A-like enzyme
MTANDYPTTRSCLFPGCLPWGNASNTPFRLFKHWVHQGGIATRLIAYWPAVIKMARITDQPGPWIDINPEKKLSAK